MVLLQTFFRAVLWTIAVLLAIPLVFGTGSSAFFTEFFFTQTGAFIVFALVFLVLYNGAGKTKDAKNETPKKEAHENAQKHENGHAEHESHGHVEEHGNEDAHGHDSHEEHALEGHEEHEEEHEGHNGHEGGHEEEGKGHGH